MPTKTLIDPELYAACLAVWFMKELRATGDWHRNSFELICSKLSTRVRGLNDVDQFSVLEYAAFAGLALRYLRDRPSNQKKCNLANRINLDLDNLGRSIKRLKYFEEYELERLNRAIAACREVVDALQ